MSDDKNTQMIDYIIEYDATDPSSIESYSKRMIGKTFRQIWEEDEINCTPCQGHFELV